MQAACKNLCLKVEKIESDLDKIKISGETTKSHLIETNAKVVTAGSMITEIKKAMEGRQKMNPPTMEAQKTTEPALTATTLAELRDTMATVVRRTLEKEGHEEGNTLNEVARIMARPQDKVEETPFISVNHKKLPEASAQDPIRDLTVKNAGPNATPALAVDGSKRENPNAPSSTSDQQGKKKGCTDLEGR